MWDPDSLGHEPNRIVREHSHLIRKGGYVLDLGTGNGRDTAHLTGLGYRVRAVDSQPEAVDFTRKMLRAAGTADGAVVELRDVLSVEEAAESVDGVVLIGVVHSLPKQDAERLYERIRRWLAPGGVLIMTAPLAAGSLGPKPDTAPHTPGDACDMDDRFAHVYEPGALPACFPDLEAVHVEEKVGINHPVCLFVARKR